VITLRRPRGTFIYELALPYVALLPPDTPLSVQTADPPPATGPYMIASSDPGRSWTYRRNPVWASHNSEAMPDLPGGHVDSIQVQVLANSATQVSEVERGRFDWMHDPPPPDLLPEVRRSYEGTQFRSEPTISNFYFWMNTQLPPFDDVRVRRAVNFALNRAALERIYAGAMRATQQVLPPGMPGHEEFRPYPHDMAKARALMARADPTDRKVTVWTNNFPPNREAGEYYEGVLRSLGFEPKLKSIEPSNYFTVIGNETTPDLDTGWGSWLLDYPHPNDYFQPQLSGESIMPAGNTN
jgi:peptide/nickel transport system substrate-binding protein